MNAPTTDAANDDELARMRAQLARYATALERIARGQTDDPAGVAHRSLMALPEPVGVVVTDDDGEP